MFEFQKQQIEIQLDDAGINFGPTPQELASRMIDLAESFCPDCGKPLDAFRMCRDVSVEDAARGLRFCGAGTPLVYVIPRMNEGSSTWN